MYMELRMKTIKYESLWTSDELNTLVQMFENLETYFNQHEET